MQVQNFGIRRSRETTKPRVTAPATVFFKCGKCKNTFQSIHRINADIPICCEAEMEILQPKILSELANNPIINYRIIGGYNENAIEISWDKAEKKSGIVWVYIKTFTGGQMKYVTNARKTSFIFALADEDAYVYCDKNPCLECTFRCKRGFEIYVYTNEEDLIKIPIDRMQASW